MQSHLVFLCAMLALGACTTAAGQGDAAACPARKCVALGQTQQLAPGLRVTPIAVVEDSRCPPDVTCAWAGRLRIRVQIERQSEQSEAVIGTEEPLRIRGGFLSLERVSPPARAANQGPPTPGEYRIAFAFAPDMMNQQG